ncbi:hypothetical protein, variant 1 [Aphanomyces astaci]|uniref:DUF1640 domain-containing protein n=1 Tax=Aphanomyces astaci TaxID=112090 RepID=W4G960_APHAT|nr:hypothetical protein, variant 1 [Aphanomyces astaci]ETV76210.1 hypothetical protein, variant 1 [Aphanomyces astaci]|eukprot:XP_009834338.1 hypothetical protein, variant 1 [Aphanomyces astaci]
MAALWRRIGSAGLPLRRGFCMAAATSVPFDTYLFAQNLKSKGFTSKEADAILTVTRAAVGEMNTTRVSLFTPKTDHLELKTDLSQKVLRSTMNFGASPSSIPCISPRAVEIAHRHMREVIERDFSNLKNDIRMTEKLDLDKVRTELAKVEREFLLQKKTDEETLNSLHIANEKLEKRILQYTVAFSGTFCLVLARVAAFF